MINYWLIAGDTHSSFNRFRKIQRIVPKDEKWGVIILGDAGINFFLDHNQQDRDLKQHIKRNYPNLEFFCVRGNHEQRPELIPGMRLSRNNDVVGMVYEEEEFPSIHYLLDGATYLINDKKTLVLGGAYSVDKELRLEREALGKYGGWFPHEQLDSHERAMILNNVRGKHFDAVLSHTCPVSWEPTEVFLSCVDQSKVDKTMEKWLEEVKDSITFDRWWFGHYHTDKMVNEKAFILFKSIKEFC